MAEEEEKSTANGAEESAGGTGEKKTRKKSTANGAEESGVTYVCIKPTFWQSKMWRVGETTNDPEAKGNCFQEV